MAGVGVVSPCIAVDGDELTESGSDDEAIDVDYIHDRTG